MHKKNYIDARFKKYLTIYDAVDPKIYGLPKIHKGNVPLRPLVSCVRYPSYNLSLFFASILYNIRDDTKNVRSSSILREALKNVNLGPGIMMVSFDLVSLFTNVPVSLLLEVIEEKLNELAGIYTTLDKKMFFEGLALCLRSSYCQYKGTICSQI